MIKKKKEYPQKRRDLENLQPGALVARVSQTAIHNPAKIGVFVKRTQPKNDENHFLEVLFKGKIESWHLSNIEILS